MDTWGYIMLRMFHGSMIFVEVGGITVFSSNIEYIYIYIDFQHRNWVTIRMILISLIKNGMILYRNIDIQV